jgi:hypothetical protein
LILNSSIFVTSKKLTLTVDPAYEIRVETTRSAYSGIRIRFHDVTCQNVAILYVFAVRTTNLVDASKSAAVIFIKTCG